MIQNNRLCYCKGFSMGCTVEIQVVRLLTLALLLMCLFGVVEVVIIEVDQDT